jgi:uncharacterized membrane protein
MITHSCSFLLLGAPKLQFPGSAQTALILLRWIHIIAGITWVGLLYFFNLVNAPFLQELDPTSRARIVPKLMPRALWWFRWSSVVTVLVGLAYWGHTVGSDARNAAALGQPASVGGMMGSFFVIWTLAFAIEMGVFMSPAEALRKGPVLAAIVAVTIVVAAYIFLSLNQHGWESNPALAIGIGGGLGWFMMLNVWGLIWRMQKNLIRWAEASASHGTPIPPEAAKVAKLVFLCSRVNFWLSFPMLFFMTAASHYVMFAAG